MQTSNCHVLDQAVMPLLAQQVDVRQCGQICHRRLYRADKNPGPVWTGAGHFQQHFIVNVPVQAANVTNDWPR
jgi:hypothetical protein